LWNNLPPSIVDASNTNDWKSKFDFLFPC
jgi:hypothetical protein